MLKKNKKLIENLIILGWSFLSMIAMAQISHYGITGIELMLPCMFTLFTIVHMKAWNVVGKIHESGDMLDMKMAIPLGIIIDICSVVGSKIDMYAKTFDEVGIVDVGYMFVLLPFFISLVVLAFYYSDIVSNKLSDKGIICHKCDQIREGEVRKKTFSKKYVVKRAGIYALIMLICWLPYYLTFFPGGVSNDNFKCINMIYGNIPWTNHHPVIYTATMKLFLAIFAGNGNLSLALGMMVLAQMIMMSFTLGISLVWLEYHGASKVWVYVSLAFMSLHSAFSMFAVCLTKDISFACVVVLLILFLYEFCEYYNRGMVAENGRTSAKHTNGYCIVLGLLSFLTIITRNNGTLVIALTLIVLIIAWKKLRKQLLIVTIVVFALNAIYKGPVWKMAGIQKQSFVEAASIPLTQIAYTIYSDGVIEGDDKAYLEEIMPFDAVKASFVPGYVDSYKFDKAFNTEIVDADPAKVIKVWWHLLPKNFGRYVKAYLYETCGYWHYGVTNTLCSEGVQPNDLGIEGTNIIEKLTGVSLWSLLSGMMLIVRKLPILCMLTQMACELLAVILTACQFVRRKRLYKIVVLIPLFAIWCSIMIAVPAYCLFRYMLPVFFLWPVTVYQFFAVKKEKDYVLPRH